MCTFHYPIGLRVVSQYPDVLGVVMFFKVGKHFDKCRPIVSDDLTKCAPSAENILKDPISDGFHGFCVKQMVFWEVHKGTAALNKILEAP